VAAIAAGGALGAVARHGVGVALPNSPGEWPWSTLLANVSGCLLIGVLVVLADAWVTHRLLRPFLGVGVLGGYTTFSAFAVETIDLAGAGRPALALAYVTVTAVAALVAVRLGIGLTRVLVARPGKPAGRPTA